MKHNVELVERAADMWARGISTTLIARRLGIPRNTLVSHAKRNRDRFPVRRGSPEVVALHADRVRRLEALWAVGYTYRQMADAIGYENVGRIITANRDRFPPRGSIRECRLRLALVAENQQQEAA